MQGWRAAVAALALGALGALAYAPWPSATLQVLSLAAAFAIAFHGSGSSAAPRAGPAAVPIPAAPRSRALRAAGIGFAYGLGLFVAGLCWLYISMHRYGGMPAPMAAAAVVLFGAYLALYPALAFGVTGWLGATGSAPLQRAGACAAFGAAWTLSEWLRGTVFTGFPWLSAGYAHVDAPLAGLAPVLGVYGVGGLAAAMAAALAVAVPRLVTKDGATAAARLRTEASPLLLVVLPLLAGLLLAPIDWARPHGAPITVRLVQGNVPQNLKFVPEEVLRAMRGYAALAASGTADLTVLPETAWTVPWSSTPPDIVQAMFAGGARSGPVAVGMPLPVPQPALAGTAPPATAASRRDEPIANSIALLRADDPSNVAARYDKHHLVPFGEFVPWGFRWFVDLMRIPLGDFARGGAAQPPFEVAGQRLSFNICYEDLFGEELLGALREGAGAHVLVNASNIAWFGDSLAPPQHLQIARMRTLETARPMLRATNTGMTASIDHRGRVLGVLAPFTTGVLVAQVQGTEGLTPFARWGNALALALAALILAVRLLRMRAGNRDALRDRPARS